MSSLPTGLYFYRTAPDGSPLKVYLEDAAWASGETMAAVTNLQGGTQISAVKRIGNFPFGPLQAGRFGPVSFKPGMGNFLLREGGPDPLDLVYSDSTIRNALQETLYGPDDNPIYPPGTFYMASGHIPRAWVFQEFGQFIQTNLAIVFNVTDPVPLDVPYLNNVTAGDLLIVVAETAAIDEQPTVDSVIDTLGNSYVRIAFGQNFEPGVGLTIPFELSIWWARSVASGANTVTLTTTGVTSDPNRQFNLTARVLEYFSNGVVNPVDSFTVNTGDSLGPGTQASGGPVTVTTGTAVLFAVTGAGAVINGWDQIPVPDFTDRGGVNGYLAVWDQLGAAPGIYSAMAESITFGASWITIMVSFTQP